MAIYHLNIRHCSRDKGQSSQAKFDYINRIDKYSKKLEDLQYSQSGNLPSFAQNNPELFWQSADKFERANARICTEIEFALPRELTLEQQTELVQSFIKKTIDNE
ncbi:MobA/MobL family protein, partial [Glaesserella parasuis]